MPSQKLISPDPLVMKVQKVLRSAEPHPVATETRRTKYGFDWWVCPVCNETVRKYNMHWAHMHATPFWKEQQIIKLMKKELLK